MEHAAFVPASAWIVPFAALLVTIAVLPLVAPRFWESNAAKFAISAAFAAPVVAFYAFQAPAALAHTARDYASFIVLLATLFVISGGVVMEGDLPATPAVNTAFLAGGTVIASFVGTTGASMLLIRPLLQTNSERRNVVHTVVFFIFLVSNVGGCLTPLGDPPLFLGYLQGVPFTWTFRLTLPWLFTAGLLLLVYYCWDRIAYGREPPTRIREDNARIRPLKVRGTNNLPLLAGVVLAAAVLDAPFRELVMVLLAAVSFTMTPRALHRTNHFSFHPIVEVAAVFAGIFLTMIPALDVMRAYGAAFPLHEPWQYFWATGLLSSFLDNAPTYLAFLAIGQGQDLTPEVVGVPHSVLTAISLGAVFMGANTYIGNGPNFMVRSIAVSRGVPMPSFGGYMLYSTTVLLPLFALVTIVFLV